MNIVILGQGAIGLLWYRALAHLAVQQPDINVKICPRPAQPETGQNFTFTNFAGLSEQRTLLTSDNKALSECDHLLVCVKSYQVKHALEPVLPHLNKTGSIILCHNGMGTLSELSPELIGKHAVMTMLTTHGCLRVKPRHIRHTGEGFSDLGLIAGRLAQEQQSELTKLLNFALPSVTWTNNIAEKQWRKLAVNCVINPLTALHQLKNGQILAEKFAPQISAILTEVCQVAKSQDIELNLREMEQVVRSVAQATGNNISSMRCDVLAGNKTEIDYISGYIHRLGQEQHIATPENTRLWQQVSALK